MQQRGFHCFVVYKVILNSLSNKMFQTPKFFIPNDVEHCITQLKSLNLKQITRTDFIQQFSRNNIMNGMTKEIGRLLYVAENHE